MTDRSVVQPAEQAIQTVNPLTSRSASAGTVAFYRIFALLSWVFFVGSAAIYTISRPKDHDGDGSHHSYRTIWEQNRLHPTPFSISPIITTVYWMVLFTAQIPYVASIFATETSVDSHASNLASHFIVSTVLGAVTVHLWVRTWLWTAFAVAILNFLNLSIGYLSVPPGRITINGAGGAASNSSSPEDGIAGQLASSPSRLSSTLSAGSAGSIAGPEVNFRLLQHFAVIAGPWAFSFLSLFWLGAAAANVHSFAGRVVANIFIWSFFFFGALILAAFRDWVMSGCLAVLIGSIGLHQFVLHTIALQWIFAFTITGLLSVATIGVAVPAIAGQIRSAASGERQPLLRSS